MTGRLIPFGYATRNSQERLEALMQDATTLIVDIRKMPYSKWGVSWRKDALMARWGDHYFGGRYRHLGALGNLAFTTQEVQLANPAYGVNEVKKLLEHGHDIILLCACAQYAQCHRKDVTELIQQAMPGVEVVQPESEAS